MTQDTRKDRRVKIVSLNVRYKSATVDEFIENHAHDVSRGGIYIKTGSPFPAGTLLKFEVRLASDQAVITGVGRVVWKRDTALGTAERPAGMGVKFIKIDDPSKAVIDKLVNTRADAGKTYEAEVEATSPPATDRPLAVAPPQVAASVASKAPPPPPAAPVRPGKSTMVGLGSAQAPVPAPARPAASAVPSPRPAGSTDMFPKKSARPEPDEAKQEPTVMKQAAELLEEALREAGGSIEDIGTNPLFSGSAAAAASPGPAKGSVSPPGGVVAPHRSGADEVTVHKLLSPVPEAPVVDASAVHLDEASKARAMVAGMSPGASTPRHPASDPPRTSRESPLAKAPRDSRSPSGRPARSSGRPSGRPSLPVEPIKKGGAGRTLVLLGAAAAAILVGVMYRDQIFGRGAAPEPSPSASASPASAPPTASAAAAPSSSSSAGSSLTEATPSAAPSGDATPSASASAARAPASAAAVTGAVPPKAAAPATAATAAVTSPTTAPPKATATATPAATAAPVATATATGTPAAAPTATAPAATASAAPAAATAPAPTKTAAPAASSKPKPAAKPADDNPY
jgi:uncharacterized protein (TIGR02266 family)